MDWLPSSLTGSLLATLIMVVICLFIYSLEKQRCLLLWSLAWTCFSARVAGEIALFNFPLSEPILIGTQLSNLGIGLFLALGTFDFLNKQVPALVKWCAAGASLALVAAGLAGLPELWVSLPAYLFIGLASLWTGVSVLRSGTLTGLGARICGWSILLWGLHRSGHAFLSSIHWLSPLNYLLATILTIGMALGLMLAYFQRTKNALRVTEQGYRQLMDSASDSIYVVSADAQGLPLRFLEVNRAAHTRLGYTREEFLQLSLLDIVPAQERGRIPALAQVLTKQGRITFEGRELTKSGQEIPVDVSLHQGSWGRQTVTLSISRDLSERKRAQAKLAELASIVANSHDSIIGFDLQGNITSWNQGAQKLYGYTAQEALGMNIAKLLPPEEFSRVGPALERLCQGQAVEVPDTPRIHKDGRRFSISVTISPVRDESGQVVGASAIGRDITETKRQHQERESILAQLRQSQKMEALGTLAGGIAHDFNNILSVIMGYTEMALKRHDQGEEVQRELTQVFTASQRARDLVRQILTFSRRGEQERRPVALKPLVAEALKMLRSTLPASIQIERQVQTKGDLVLADPTQIHQVLMNLCTNAAQAMTPGGGVLRVALTDVEPGELPGGLAADLEPGPYLALAVSDTGCGMSPEVRERALEPFFTTKEPSQGTGLGLSVVHGIVQSHQGALSIQSQPGQGSTFAVFLPRLEQAARALPTQKPPLARGHERVMLVEDEETLCQVEAERLEWLGYQVSTHLDSREAWRALESGAQVDLLLTDLTMPGLGGLDLARQARGLRPGLAIVIYSGHPDQVDPDTAQALGLSLVLRKPVSIEEMSLAIRTALDQASALGQQTA